MANARRSEPFLWSPAIVERLETLSQEGKSASEIAAAIGCPSRNAVIGKMGRLGIPLSRGPVAAVTRQSRAAAAEPAPKPPKPVEARPKRAKDPAPEPRAAPPRAPGRIMRDNLPWAALPPAKAPPPEPIRVIQTEGRLLCLTDLGPRQCRFVVNDPGPNERHIFCAADSGEASYCPSHLALCVRATVTVDARRWMR